MNPTSDQASIAAPERRLGPTFNEVNVGFRDGPVDYLLMFYTAYFAFQLSQPSTPGRPDVRRAYYVESISIYKEPALRLSLYHEYLVATIRSINPRDTRNHYFLFERTSGKLNREQKREEFVPEKQQDADWQTESEGGSETEADEGPNLHIPERRPEEKILISKFKGNRRIETAAATSTSSMFTAAADLTSSASESSSANLILAEDSFQIIDSPKRSQDDIEVASLHFGEPPERLSRENKVVPPAPLESGPSTRSLGSINSPSPVPTHITPPSPFRSSRPPSPKDVGQLRPHLSLELDRMSFSQNAPGETLEIDSQTPSLIISRSPTSVPLPPSPTGPYLVPTQPATPISNSNASSIPSLLLPPRTGTLSASASTLASTSSPRQLPSPLQDGAIEENENSAEVGRDDQVAEHVGNEGAEERSQLELLEEKSGPSVENDRKSAQGDQDVIYENALPDLQSNYENINSTLPAVAPEEHTLKHSFPLGKAPSKISLSRVPTGSSVSSAKTHASFVHRMMLRRTSSSTTRIYDSLPISPERPHIYLYELVVLACRLHKCKSLYRIFTRNCYWFVGMIFHVLRKFTKTNDASLVSDEGEKNILGPSDEVHRWINSGRMGTFMRAITVVKAPRIFTIDAVMRKWHGAVTRFHDDVELNRRNNQAGSRAYLDDVFESELKKRDEAERKKIEEANARAEEEKRRAEEEKRRAEEEKRRAEEAERRADEEKRRADEAEEEKRRIEQEHEEERKRTEREREEERKRTEREREEERKRTEREREERMRIEREREEEKVRIEQEREEEKRKIEEDVRRRVEETRKRMEEEFQRRWEEYQRASKASPDTSQDADLDPGSHS